MGAGSTAGWSLWDALRLLEPGDLTSWIRLAGLSRSHVRDCPVDSYGQRWRSTIPPVWILCLALQYWAGLHLSGNHSGTLMLRRLSLITAYV